MTPLADLAERSTEPELLDLGVSDAEARRSLSDLRFVNQWLGGSRGILDAVRPYLPPGGRLLDVGCGSADVPARVAAAVGGGTLAVGVDRKHLHLREAPAGVSVVVADARALPFGAGAFDVVTVSHFLHHFDAGELVELLRALLQAARGALVVSDLHRHRVPHLFGRAFFPLLFSSPVSVADGLVSIRRGFRPGELRGALEAAGARSVSVRRVFPYRLLAVATPPGRGPS